MLIFHLANISAISLFVNSCCYCYYCHLLRTILIINLVSLSHTYTCHISSYYYFCYPKSRVTVSYNGKPTVLILYHRCYLYSVWISALFCCSAQLRPLAGNHLRPQTEVVFRGSAATMSTYMSICQCIH